MELYEIQNRLVLYYIDTHTCFHIYIYLHEHSPLYVCISTHIQNRVRAEKKSNWTNPCHGQLPYWWYKTPLPIGLRVELDFGYKFRFGKYPSQTDLFSCAWDTVHYKNIIKHIIACILTQVTSTNSLVTPCITTIHSGHLALPNLCGQGFLAIIIRHHSNNNEKISNNKFYVLKIKNGTNIWIILVI